MKFNNGKEFYDAIESGDLYNDERCIYAFIYNDRGAVCVYDISNEEAEDLEKKSEEYDEYWGAFLGIGGLIYDEPMEFCDNEYHGEWRRV